MSEPGRTASLRLYLLCLVLLVSVVFVNGITTPFVLDDRMVFETGNTIRSFANAWSSGPTRRIGMLSFAANFRVHGLYPPGFHAGNIAIHAAAALTLFGLAQRTFRLPGIPPWLAERSDAASVILAAIWAIHPLQTASVTYCVQRFESLAGLFCLTSLYAFVRGTTAQRGWPWYVASVLAAALAVQTKETSFGLPLLILAYDRIFLSPSWRTVFRRRWFWHALQVACSVWLLIQVRWAFDPVPAASVGLGVRGLTSWMYLRSQAGVILHYLRLAVVPDTLCLDYAWPVAFSFWEIYPPGAVVLVLLALTAAGLYRVPRLGFLGLAFFCLLAPSSSFVPIADLAFEHRMYLPLAPAVALAVLAATWALDRLQTKGTLTRRAFAVGLTLIVVAYGARTVFRNRDYRDPLRLWRQAVAVNPRHSRAYTWIGMCHYERGNNEEAIRHYRLAIRVNPRNWLAQLNLGVVYMAINDEDQATRCFQRCLEVNPGYPVAYQNYGSLLLRQGKIDQAIQSYRWAVHYAPADPRMWNTLGLGYLEAGDRVRAKKAFERAKAVDPTNPDAPRLLARMAAGASLEKKPRESLTRDQDGIY